MKQKEKNTHNTDLLGIAIGKFYDEALDQPLEVWIDGELDHLLYPSVFFRSYKKMNRLEKLALSHCYGRILDIGAGAGCHSLYLQQKNFNVTALDISEECCRVMKSLGLKQVENHHLAEYHTGGFDTILLLMNGLGIAGKKEAALAMLYHLKKQLNSGGQILLDSTDIAYTMATTPKDDDHETVQMELNKGVRSVLLDWYYPSQESLKVLAKMSGLNCNILHSDRKHRFLARLTV